MELASDSIVDRVYEQLKAMAVSYELKPGERLNEGELAKRLGVSRTPLREALNRLNTEGFLRFTPGKGSFCRELDAHEIFDLYELRKSIEVASIRLAIKRAKDEDIDALLKFLEATGPDPGERIVGRTGRTRRDLSRAADGDVEQCRDAARAAQRQRPHPLRALDRHGQHQPLQHPGRTPRRASRA